MFRSRASLGEAIVAFLKAEYDSPTEGARLRDTIEASGFDDSWLRGEATAAREDAARFRLFERYRGGETLFHTLDLRSLEWWWAALSADDLEHDVFTCRHGFEERYGTRQAAVIAAMLERSDAPNGVLDRVRAGEVLEPPLLVSTGRLDRLVILEGHNRLLGYLRDLSAVNLPLPVLIGIDGRVAQWREW